MPVTSLALNSTYRVNTSFSSLPRTNSQAVKTTDETKAYNVDLSDTAQARSLKLQGFSASMIAGKLDVDLSTVLRYLGTASLAISTNQSTSTSPTQGNQTLQFTKSAELPTTPSFTVELSGAALARSLQLQGYTVSLIALKMGLPAATVNQYLGITTSPQPATVKSTYVAPKSTYVAPKAPYAESTTISRDRSQLTQQLNQLPAAQFDWSNLMNGLLTEAQAAT